jgi:hypothetical protein
MTADGAGKRDIFLLLVKVTPNILADVLLIDAG